MYQLLVSMLKQIMSWNICLVPDVEQIATGSLKELGDEKTFSTKVIIGNLSMMTKTKTLYFYLF